MFPAPTQPHFTLLEDLAVRQTEHVFNGMNTVLSRACINATRFGRYFDGHDGTRVVGIVDEDAMADNNDWSAAYTCALRQAALLFRTARPNWTMGSLTDEHEIVAVLFEESSELRRLWRLGRLRRYSGQGRCIVSGLVVYAFDLRQR